MHISVIYKKDSWLNAFKYAGKSQSNLKILHFDLFKNIGTFNFNLNLSRSEHEGSRPPSTSSSSSEGIERLSQSSQEA